MKNTTLKDLQNRAFEEKSCHYYIVECPACHEKIAVQYKNVTINLFEPKEVEVEYDVLDISESKNGELGDYKGVIHKKVKELRSTDTTKDIVTIELCPNCGHRNITMLKDEFLKLPCVNRDGKNTIQLLLDEVETNAAREFMEAHKNCCEEHLGKKYYSSTGGQFTYTITPTGLGNLVHITCNSCKEGKDITNVDNW